MADGLLLLIPLSLMASAASSTATIVYAEGNIVTWVVPSSRSRKIVHVPCVVPIPRHAVGWPMDNGSRVSKNVSHAAANSGCSVSEKIRGALRAVTMSLAAATERVPSANCVRTCNNVVSCPTAQYMSNHSALSTVIAGVRNGILLAWSAVCPHPFMFMSADARVASNVCGHTCCDSRCAAVSQGGVPAPRCLGVRSHGVMALNRHSSSNKAFRMASNTPMPNRSHHVAMTDVSYVTRRLLYIPEAQ